MALISLEDHVHQIYEEIPKHLIAFTPQLYTSKEGASSQSIQAHGSAILINKGREFYLVTARHCVKQQTSELIKLQVLNSVGIPISISGLTASIKGENDTVDLTAIHLQSDSVEHLLKSNQFLDYRKILPASHIAGETDYLVVGHTLSQTSIDNKKRTTSSAPFVHTGKSIPIAQYPKIAFNSPAPDRNKYFIDPKTNTLIRYDQRRSTIMGSNMMSMGPMPKGISGCGVWYIPSYVVSDPSTAGFCLIGIIIEYHPNRRMLLATNAEQILSLIH